MTVQMKLAAVLCPLVGFALATLVWSTNPAPSTADKLGTHESRFNSDGGLMVDEPASAHISEFTRIMREPVSDSAREQIWDAIPEDLRDAVMSIGDGERDWLVSMLARWRAWIDDSTKDAQLWEIAYTYVRARK